MIWVLLLTLKLSNVEPGWYLDRWLLENPRCCNLCNWCSNTISLLILAVQKKLHISRSSDKLSDLPVVGWVIYKICSDILYQRLKMWKPVGCWKKSFFSISNQLSCFSSLYTNKCIFFKYVSLFFFFFSPYFFRKNWILMSCLFN